MDMVTLRIRIKQIIADTVHLPSDDFPDDMPLFADKSIDEPNLGFDSIGILELSLSLEEEFGYATVPDEEINPDDFRTVDAVVNYVAARKAAARRAAAGE